VNTRRGTAFTGANQAEFACSAVKPADERTFSSVTPLTSMATSRVPSMSPGRTRIAEQGWASIPHRRFHKEAHDLAAQVVGRVTGLMRILGFNRSELAGTVCPDRERWRFHLNQQIRLQR